ADRSWVRCESHTVMLLVSLYRGANRCTWDTGFQVALRCRDLCAFLASIPLRRRFWKEVEILESQITPFASPASSTLASAVDWRFSQGCASDEIDFDEEFTALNGAIISVLPFPGHRIQQEVAKEETDAPAASVTMGLFLRLQAPSGDNSKDGEVVVSISIGGPHIFLPLFVK
ncbi:hypothetical protein SEUCBS140593_008275, partial [Sporothrix eucalyptigena]